MFSIANAKVLLIAITSAIILVACSPQLLNPTSQTAPEQTQQAVQPPPLLPPTITHEEEYESYVNTLADKQFAQYALDTKIGFSLPKELRNKFLVDPVANKVDFLNYFLGEINKANPEVATELKKLPDLQDMNVDTIKKLEAIEDIFTLSKTENVLGVTTFSSIFNEGLKDKRKYCSALQALLWAMYPYEVGYLEKEKPWKDFNLYPGTMKDGSKRDPDKIYRDSNLLRLIGFAWNTSDEDTKIRGYQGVNWENFEEVTDRLNSPDLLVIYMNYNFSYDWDKYNRWIAGDHTWDLAETTFKKKKSDCGGLSMVPFYSLLKNGWTYDNFDGNKNNSACLLGCQDPTGVTKGSHTVLLLYTDIYNPSVKNFYTIDSNVVQATLKGPFPDIATAADNTFIGWKQYIFFNTNATYTKIVNK